MTQAQTKGIVLIQEEITTQSMEVLTGKAMQIKAKGRELADKFHSLETIVEGARTT
jgi:hypothetical protein